MPKLSLNDENLFDLEFAVSDMCYLLPATDTYVDVVPLVVNQLKNK